MPMSDLSSMVERETGAKPLICTAAAAASLAECVDSLATRMGQVGRYVSIGRLNAASSQETQAHARPAARLLAGPSASIALLAEPKDGTARNGAVQYQVSFSLSAAVLEAIIQQLLGDAEWGLQQGERESLAALLETRPFEDTSLDLATSLLGETQDQLLRVEEAARDRDRARLEVQARLEQAQRNRVYVGLAQGLGHHQNNRLAVVMARAGLLPRVSDDETVARCAADITQACRSCTDFLARFLSYAAQTPTGPVLPTGLVDDIVGQALATVQPLIASCPAEGRVTVETQLQCGQAVALPREDLQAGIEAILANAVEAMPTGGTLSVRTHDESGWAIVEIEDTGMGMPHSVASKVFNPFFTTKGPERAGVSLSHIHSTVVQHGGSIDVVTEAGKGTTFRLRLPTGNPRICGLGSSSRRAGPGPVLVIEDEDDVREALSELIGAMGWPVRSARDGHEAERLTDGGGIGLIITDLGVPDFSAFELTRRLRDKGVQAPVILLTGWVRDVDCAAASAAGVDLILSKPISAEELAEALRRFGVEG